MSLGDKPTVGGVFWHYRLYAADGTLLYLGVTSKPEQRIKSHRTLQPWFPSVRTIVWTSAGSHRAAAMQSEAEAIEAELPVYATTASQIMRQRVEHRHAAHRDGRRCSFTRCRHCSGSGLSLPVMQFKPERQATA